MHLILVLSAISALTYLLHPDHKKLDRDPVDCMPRAFEDTKPFQYDKCYISLCAKSSEILQKCIILRNKNINRVLCLGLDRKF